MKRRAASAVLLVAAGLIEVARSAMNFPLPSYYPHEIRIETLSDQAAGLLLQGKIQAYLGPNRASPTQRQIRSARSSSWVRSSSSESSGIIARPDHAAACVLARTVLRELQGGRASSGFIPIRLPLRRDYLYTPIWRRRRISSLEFCQRRRPCGRPASTRFEELAKSLVRAEWHAGIRLGRRIDEVSAADSPPPQR